MPVRAILVGLFLAYGAFAQTPLKEKAEKGDADAQFTLGMMYFEGRSVPRDYVESARWFRKAAEQGHAIAQYSLGSIYENGRGFPKDTAEAARWYRKAADQGEANAQFKLGVKYSVGSGVPQDQAAAENWLRLAADQDDPDAQILLAWMDRNGQARNGQESAKHSADAVRRLREAAEQGSVSAQSSLGEKYRDGEGVPQDNVLAYLWFNLAASAASSQDKERNAAARDNVAAKMTSRQFAEAQRLAREWKPGVQ